MDSELLYRYLMDSAVFFLATWLLMLAGACTLAFRAQGEAGARALGGR